MDTYSVYFVVLVVANIALAYHRHHAGRKESPKETLSLAAEDDKLAASRFKKEYFTVYALVLMADWLQVRSPLELRSS